MAIEFRCTQCGSLLRVPDETAGKMAKCPSCGQVLPIPRASTATTPSPAPATSGNPFAAPGGAPSFPPMTDNPYQSPAAAPLGSRIDYSAADLQPINPSPLDVGEVMRRSWVIFKDNAGMLIVGMLIVQAITFAMNMATNAVIIPLGIAMPNNQGVQIAAQIVMFVLMQLVTCWIQLGQFRFLLRVARGGEPVIADLFTGSKGYLANLAASILFMLGFAGLAAVSLAPGLVVGLITGNQNIGIGVAMVGALIGGVFWVYFMLTYSQFMFAIADRSVGAMESFRISAAITSGNRMSLFLLGLLASLAMMVGFLACCVGMLASIPYGWMCFVVAYLMMSGQPTAGGPPTA